MYRHKKFSLKVRLVDQSKQKVMNTDVVTLQLGIYDKNGEWVTQNSAKGNIMTGTTESELCRG